MSTLTRRTRLAALALAALTALAGGAGMGRAGAAPAAPAAGGRAAEPAPDPAAATAAIERFLRTRAGQTPGDTPGEVSVTVEPGSVARVPGCKAYEPFMAGSIAAWGRVSVGLRCRDARPWTRFVQAHVAVEGRYLVATRQIERGEAVGAGDFEERQGDLSGLPRGVLTDPQALQGMSAVNRIVAGAPLRRDLLRGNAVVQQGQTVQVVAQGAGFTITMEGRAMARAEAGAQVQAKIRDGRVVSGVAQEDGQIRLTP